MTNASRLRPIVNRDPLRYAKRERNRWIFAGIIASLFAGAAVFVLIGAISK